MPRPRQQNSVPQLSAGQASYVIDRLVSDRRVSPGEIARYVGEMHREISDLEARLASLRTAAGHSSGGGQAAPAKRRGRPAGSGAKAAVSASSGSTGSGQQQVRRGPGRPPGSGAATGRRRGRPPGGSKNAAAANTGGGASAQQSGGASASSQQSGAKSGGRGRKRSSITPEQLASRQLQGRYLGLIRQVPANKRAQYQKIAKEKGREAAIRELQDVVKK